MKVSRTVTIQVESDLLVAEQGQHFISNVLDAVARQTADYTVDVLDPSPVLAVIDCVRWFLDGPSDERIAAMRSAINLLDALGVRS